MGTKSPLKLVFLGSALPDLAFQVSALLNTKIPTLFLNGPFDPVSGQHMLDAFRDRAPMHRAKALAGQVGHYPQLEAPAEVIASYFPFLDEVAAKKPAAN